MFSVFADSFIDVCKKEIYITSGDQGPFSI